MIWHDSVQESYKDRGHFLTNTTLMTCKKMQEDGKVLYRHLIK